MPWRQAAAAWPAATAASGAVRNMHTASALAHAAAAASPAVPAATPRRRLVAHTAPAAPLPTPTLLPAASPTFEQLRVPLNIVHRLAENSIHRPTVIQRAVLPHLMRRPWDAPSYPDVLVQEMTGQGKTLAYLLPLLANIDRTVPRIQAMIIVPTRELAVQVTRVLHELAAPTSSRALPLAVATLLGDAANPSMLSGLVRAAQRASPLLRRDEGVDASASLLPSHHPHVIVGQAGAVHDIFVQRALSDVRTVLPLTHLKYLVFDEADALLNAASSRNLVLPLIGLRHSAVALSLENVKAEQAHLDATREERRQRKKRVDEDIAAEAEAERAQQQRAEEDQEGENDLEDEQAEDDAEQHDLEQPQEQTIDLVATQSSSQSAANDAAPEATADSTTAADSTAASSSTSVASAAPIPSTSSSLPAFPRNQVVLVSATITPAVHQFAARFLSSSRAFLTAASVAGEADRIKALKHRLMQHSVGSTPDEALSLLPDASTSPAAQLAEAAKATARAAALANRMPVHLRHYYVLVNRPYDRQNTLQQLLQAIKFQFERWKRDEIATISTGGDANVLSAKPPSASWIAKHMGPRRAQSAGGDPFTNATSPIKYLKGGVSSMGVGARAHFMQTTLVFCNQRVSLAPLVNPLSQQGFNVGVISEHSSRHERREGLQLHKGVELVLATDVLARGMDLKALTHVVNWDVPATPSNYLHRAGRVGRLGAVHARLGTVITLVDLQKDPRALEHLAKICATLSGNNSSTEGGQSQGGADMHLQRLYVKKGHLFVDVDPSHDIKPHFAPDIQLFVADKEGRALARKQNREELAAANKAAETEAQLKKNTKKQAKRSTVADEDDNNALADADDDFDAESSSSSLADAELDGSSLEFLDPSESHSAALPLETPMFGSGGLNAGSIAALELAQGPTLSTSGGAAGGASTKKNKQRKPRHNKEPTPAPVLNASAPTGVGKNKRDQRQQAAIQRRR